MNEQRSTGIGMFMFIGGCIYIVAFLSEEVPLAIIGFSIFILGIYINWRYGI